MQHLSSAASPPRVRGVVSVRASAGGEASGGANSLVTSHALAGIVHHCPSRCGDVLICQRQLWVHLRPIGHGTVRDTGTCTHETLMKIKSLTCKKIFQYYKLL